jgi:hypothetical protein
MAGSFATLPQPTRTVLQGHEDMPHLLPRDLLAAAITGQWELGADLIVCLKEKQSGA